MKKFIALRVLTLSAFAAQTPEFSDVYVAGKHGVPAIRIPSFVVTKAGTLLAIVEAGRRIERFHHPHPALQAALADLQICIAPTLVLWSWPVRLECGRCLGMWSEAMRPRSTGGRFHFHEGQGTFLDSFGAGDQRLDLQFAGRGARVGAFFD
ncbi:MAG: sialidase family protein [Verrucomicrobiota bacterium]|jgi:hypothetical protein